MSFDVEDTEDKYGIISICFKGYGIGIFVFTGLYTILAFILSFDNAVLAYVFGLFFGLQYMYSFAARVFLRNKLFVFSGVVNTLTIAVVNIVLILCFHMGVESLYIAQIAGCFLQCLIVEIRLHLISNTFKKPFDGAKFKAILKFSVPLCIATVSYWLLSGFTKIIINSVCGSDENGLFAIASSLANVAVIELMARTKQILSAANRYNGTNAINVSDVFVLFGTAALIYFVINFSISMVVRSMQKRRTKQ